MICTKSRKDWKEKWGNVLLVQKFNYKERTPRSLLITEFVCFVFLKKLLLFFNLFFSFLKISWPWWQNTCILTTLFGSAGYKKCFRYIWLAKSLYWYTATGSACASLCFSIQICIFFSYPALTQKLWGQPWSASLQWQSGSTWWCCGCVIEEEALHIL